MEISRITVIDDEIVECFRRLMPQLSPAIRPPDKQELEEMVAVDNCALLAARDDAGGEIIGTLTLLVFRAPTGVQAWIEDVVVDEKPRGRRAGYALMKAALETARSSGANCVSLTSRPARREANRLYKKLGFTRPKTNYYRYMFEGR